MTNHHAASRSPSRCLLHQQRAGPLRSSQVARTSSAEDLAATACVFDLIEKSTRAIIVKRAPHVDECVGKHREALRRARVLTAEDPTTLEIKDGPYEVDLEAESRVASLQSRQAIRAFEASNGMSKDGDEHLVHARGRSVSCEEGPVDWSADATALSNVALARETTEVGPRVTFEEAYAHFRSLNLAARNVSRIDPAFIHFENLTELDIGRNRLSTLENIPRGLVTLSCAANKLSGHVFNDIPELPLLVSLDLSYNVIADYSFASACSSRKSSNRGDRSSQRVGRTGNINRLTPSENDTMSPSLSFYDKFSALEHLDLSWNVLCDLHGVLNALGPLKGSIRHLFLCGNPVGLLPFYRERVLGACGQQLLVLDDLRVGIDERADGAANFELLHEMKSIAEDSAWPVTQEVNRGDYGGALNTVHFNVQILSMSNLPEIGPSIWRPTVLEGVDSTTKEAGFADDEPKDSVQWGHIEFYVPGAEHLDSLQTGDFEWTRDIICPGKHQDELGDDTKAVPNPILASPPASGASVTVAPSQMMRDGVRLGGLGVSLFIGKGESEETAVAQVPRQRWQMVGRGSLDISSFLDSEWMRNNRGRVSKALSLPAVTGNNAHPETGSGAETRTVQGEKTNEKYVMRDSGSPAEQAAGEGRGRGATIRGEVQLNLERWVDHAQQVHITATKGDTAEYAEGKKEDVEGEETAADLDTFTRSPPVTVEVEVVLNSEDAIQAWSSAT